MFENYLVSTKFTYALFQHKRHQRAVHIKKFSIKRLLRKILQTLLEHMVIRILFYHIVVIQLATLSKTIARYSCFAVNFMKFLRTILRITIANDCS